MPRITPCRTLKVFLFVWLVMVFLWFSLPSPTISLSEREPHIQKILASGRPLITVNDWDRSFNVHDNGQMSNGKALIVRWQLATSAPSQDVQLKIGDSTYLNLPELMAEAQDFHARAGRSTDSDSVPYFGEALTIDGIWASDVEFSVICLEWFHAADKHLITHEMHGFTGGMVLRPVVPQPGVLQLWKDAVVTGYMDAADREKMKAGAIENASNEQKIYEKSWEKLRDTDHAFGLLATCKDVEMKEVDKVVVEGMQGDLLSKTYPIRRALLVPLAPTLSIGLFLIYALYDMIAPLASGILLLAFEVSMAFAGIMLSCWLRDGRPNFREWTKGFWMTRWIPRGGSSSKRKVWGPAGPVLAGRTQGDEWDVEKSMGLQRPQTVRLGRPGKS